MTERSRQRLWGTGALVALAVLLVGPPLALVRFVGWPLPTTVPGFEEVTSAARGGLDDVVVVKILAVLAWLLWAQLSAAALAETVAVIRGRPAPRAAALPGLQLGVARLVAAAALVVGGLSTPRSDPAPMARLAAVLAEPAPLAVSDQAIPAPAVDVRQAEPAPARGAVYVVRRNDSWWGIAERVLGDGQRWRELRSLNVGRQMPDGATVVATTQIIQPGWELLLPPGALGTGAPASTEPDAGGEIAVRVGDNLWDIAERQLVQPARGPVPEAQVRGYWVRLIEANRDRVRDADRIYPGQRLRLPAVTPTPPPSATEIPALPHPAPPEPTPDSPPPSSAAPPPALPVALDGADRTPAGRARAEKRAVDGDERAGAGRLGVAGAMLAVGIAAAVTRRRRRRQLTLPPGSQPVPPPAHLDDLRAEVATAADVDLAERLRLAMRDAAVCLADRDSPARPRLIQVAGSRVEALLSRAVLPAPAGWRAEASGLAWVLEGHANDRGGDASVPSPALVTIGAEEDGSALFFDLEAEGMVSLSGDPDAIADVARSWVLELATSPLSSGVSVVVVGEALVPPPEASERVRVADRWEEVAIDVLSWTEQSAAVIAANRWPTPLAGRVRTQRSDDLAPLVVFLHDVPDDDAFASVSTTLAGRSAAVAVVVVGEGVPGATTVEVSGGQISVPSLGLTCPAQALTTEAAEEVGDLLADAAAEPAQLTLIPPPSPRPRIAVATSATEEYQDPPYEILVRLLGEICVIGGRKKLTPKQTAVVAYIALHGPVPAERVEDAVWVAPTSSRHKRLANTVSECRTALGAAHLPAAADGRYRQGPDMITDLELFDRRLAYALGQDDHRAVKTLRGALELVHGPVFTYRNADRSSFVWVDVENWISTWELRVCDAAEDLARRCLALGDVDGAIWSAQRGLGASSTHPRLTKLLMQAYSANGDRMAAARVFESHQSALEQLELDDIDPELVDFYQQARRGTGVAAS
ncbi:MAG: LysM peptidoglycan-binding domain-containing protein [Actinobacteria bacterium]|nr:LysM peptidoglycan-binding domain-containing protein [Actinomycetota bacterium]